MTQLSMIQTQYPFTNLRTGRTEWMTFAEERGKERDEYRLQSRRGRRQIGRL